MAVVIGAAFGAVITSFVTNVLTPIIGTGSADFSGPVLHGEGGARRLSG